MLRAHSFVFAALLVGVMESSAAELVLENKLSVHPSPYLALHGEDPVHWQVWGRAALETARRHNRLLLVSSGYFSCHWCHVMQRESYRSPAIAGLLNSHFVTVKVDRELRPALDAALIDFVQTTRGHAGWPLNVFLTPDGYPLYGTVYLAPAQFKTVLEGLRDLWSQRETELRASAIAVHEKLASARPPARRLSGPIRSAEYRQRLVRQSLQLADVMAGGFGDQNKFPSTPQLLALLQTYGEDPDPELGEFLGLTLNAMADLGLRDQVGGGFFRYCVDPGWETPHFEKMLYDNALLAELYLRAAAVLDEPRLGWVARDTLEFLIRHFRAPDGALYASLSAVDSEGAEGAYYLWGDPELDRVLNAEERQVVASVWAMNTPPAFSGGYLPMRQASNAAAARELGSRTERVAALLDSARAKLSRERNKRQIPIDTKRLAAWNGLALATFSIAAGSGLDEYREAARGIRNYLVEVLWDGTALARARSDGVVSGEAALEDYAYAARGLWYWAQLPGNDGELALVRRLVEEAWTRFRVPAGWRSNENPLLPIGPAEPVLSDGPVPSPSAVLLEISLNLSERQRDARLYSRVLAAARVETEAVRASPFSYASHVALLARLGD